ncbi:MAG: hypothetical protein ACJ75Q_05755 [Gaiellaceae bacterium]
MTTDECIALTDDELVDATYAVVDDLAESVWATAFLAGLRRGELRALRCSDVDWPAATSISVSRGWDDVEGEIGPKSKKGKRTVPVAAELRRYLLAHKLASGRDGDELLFGPFRPHSVQRRADEAWTAADLPRLTCTSAATPTYR